MDRDSRLTFRLTALSLVTLLFFAAGDGLSYGVDFQDDEKKRATKAPQANGTPALWSDRGDFTSLNLYWGSGSEQSAPKPPFTFVKEDTSGTNPKVIVTDAAGAKWQVKLDEEVQAEVASSRLAWAAGYMVDETYFVPTGKIEGVKGLGRAGTFINDQGFFMNARFEKRHDTIARRNVEWKWDSNPFSGTKELSGLIILNVMLNNWDPKSSNNEILSISDPDGVKEWYIVSDWGGTFGRMGGIGSRSKWDLKAFTKQDFIAGVAGGRLKLAYQGKGGEVFKSVPLEHAQWFAGIIGQLTDQQLRDAFRVAGATEDETSGFAMRLRQKITALQAAVGGLSVSERQEAQIKKIYDQPWL